MKPRRGLIIYIPAAALLLATSANATNGRTFTCHESNQSQWRMTQPQAHVDAGHWPNWQDCLAWRNGDPGPDYQWSYGLTTVTTTTSAATTTTTEPTTTTVPADTVPSSTAPAIPDTTEPVPTSTTETPTTPPTTENPPTTTTYQPTTSAPMPSTTQTTANPIETTTSVDTTDTIAPTTTVETPTSPETVPPAPTVTPTPENAVQGVTSDLAEGVTPEAARVVILSTIGTFMISAAPATQGKTARGKTTRGN